MDALPGVLNLAAAGRSTWALPPTSRATSCPATGWRPPRSDGSTTSSPRRSPRRTPTCRCWRVVQVRRPRGRLSGVVHRETSAAIGLLGNAGIQGSEAGTALRGSIARLLSPTAEVTSKLAELGVSVTDSKGQLLPLVDIIGQLEGAGASTADMMDDLRVEAGPAMQALVSRGRMPSAPSPETCATRAEPLPRSPPRRWRGSTAASRSCSPLWKGWRSRSLRAACWSGHRDSSPRSPSGRRRWPRRNPWLLKIGVVLGIVAAAIGPLLIVVGMLITSVGAIAGVMTPSWAWSPRSSPGSQPSESRLDGLEAPPTPSAPCGRHLGGHQGRLVALWDGVLRPAWGRWSRGGRRPGPKIRPPR
ncbi:phage tail tape measure protein [Nocardiopsis sp. CNT-189]|uniref:phage tail tape measure protein n=1 Tax=Nocardiopsis oceanisediminis TaxID=2816862 RepID=UPI003B2C2056